MHLNFVKFFIAFFIASFSVCCACANEAINEGKTVITKDSTSGWLPTKKQQLSVANLAKTFLRLLDEGQYTPAYALLNDSAKKIITLEKFTKLHSEFKMRAGKIKFHHLVKISWTKDPKNAPTDGIYTAVDISSEYSNIDRSCGYIVIYQKSVDDKLTIMRSENNFIDNKTADMIEKSKSRAEFDRLWGSMSSLCTN